jgi:adenylate kinase family enzyme
LLHKLQLKYWIDIVRITLAEPVSPDFSKQLSQALALHLIQPEVFYDSATGLASDDRTIDAMIDAIEKQTNCSESAKGFILNNYPQNVTQAQAMDMALARIGQPVSIALMVESTKKPQNRENRALIRYYRSQNKLILFDEADSIGDICSKIRLIYEKRRGGSD